MGDAMGTPSRGLDSRANAHAAHAESVTEANRRDLQRLLSDTVRRLRRNTDARSVVAWALHTNGDPYIAAADFAEEPPATPSRALFDEIAAFPGSTHLSDPHASDACVALGREARANAVVPIAATGTPALACLLLDGEVEPATLAALDAAAQQVAVPLTTALSIGRLSALDGNVRALDRLAALGALATEVAHEIRNPLVTLATFIEVLPERREDPEFLTRYRDVVQQGLRRMSRLLDLMTQHAQPERARSHESADVGSDLESVIEGVVELLHLRASARSIEIRVEGLPASVELRIAEDALRQVLFNLIQNAVEATPAGGLIEVSTRLRPREARIEIHDQGDGIPESQRERVFEPFYTTRKGGQGGLGLAITRRIVEDVGGSVSASNAPGGGALFVLRLPRL